MQTSLTKDAGDISQRFESILNHMPGILYRCTAADGFPLVWLGGQVEETLGFSRDEIINDVDDAWTNIVHPDDRDRVMAELQAAIDARKPWQLDFRINAGRKRQGWVKGFGSGLYDAQGNIETLEGVIIDMTEQMSQKEEWQARAQQARERNVRIVAATADILETLQSLSVLSINASIEAARAGDAGRGFSVVAQEMNRLAARAEVTATAIRQATGTARNQPGDLATNRLSDGGGISKEIMRMSE